ncbi:MAG: HNH endonuclease family protein [Nostoc sp.]|uniref:HNH endonuclease family protein n=1 Tax=Nostoc sp. TaxID=1180 RepID=UPI002FFAA42D
MFFALLIGFPSQAIFSITGFNTLEKAINLSKSKVTAEKLIKELEEIFNEIYIEKGAFKRIKSEFKTRDFYKWRGIKYFLYEYDLYLQSLSKHSQKKINWDEFTNNDSTEDYRTVEHIYPQTDKDKYWRDAFQNYTTKEKNLLKNSLGNLLPLSSAKNSSFSNKSFLVKKGNETNAVGYRYGSFSENEVANYEHWTAKEIFRRGIHLLNFMEERWKFSIGNDQEKVDFLGIGFVLKKENLSN